MTIPPQPNPRHDADSGFTPNYQTPPWYHDHQSPQPPVTGHPPFGPAFSPAAPAGCKVCGATPAASVTIRAHQGFLIAMRWHKVDGLLCSVCGTALLRTLTTKTLCQGWWSIGSLIFGALFTLISNWAAHRKLRRLQPAAPAPGKRQLPLGKPVLHRPLAYVALIPLAWATVVLTHAITSAA